MPRSAQDLRQQAHDMERDAQSIVELEQTIKFLDAHNIEPSVEVMFPGFRADGAQAAEQVERWVTCEWDRHRVELLRRFCGRLNDLKAKWD